jgi:tocopherol cyclase
MASLIKNPLLYQGRNKKKNYFEGWYFKQVNEKQSQTLALIPGVSLDESNPHAFIQVIHSQPKMKSPATWYVRYELSDFHYQDHPFMIQIGQSTFHESGFDLDINNETIALSGSVHFHDQSPIETSFLSPSIMGPFAYLQFMECYHGVLSMNHLLHGSVILNTKEIDFTNGRGYLEKDWGSSFPKEYVWIQTNHFKEFGNSLMVSVAHIPFLGLSFKGFLVNFHCQGKEYRFATYNNSKIIKEDTLSNQRVELHFKRGKKRLEIVATSTNQASLAAPKNGSMDHAIKEGLSGEVVVRLYEQDKLIYEGLGTCAGVEIATLEKTT